MHTLEDKRTATSGREVMHEQEESRSGQWPRLADIINSFHPGRATLKAAPNMDHYLTKAASMEESMKRAEAGAGGEFEPLVLDAVRD